VAIAYSISALCSTMDIANAVVPTILAIMLFLSGFLIRIPSIPVYLRWLTWIDLLKYSWGGLMVNQFENNLEATLGQGTGSVLNYYDLTLNKWAYLGIVIGFFFAWAVLCWFALTFVNHQRR
jgi:ATP-binding cassette subfamily G (WHITE) protein 2